MFWLYQPRHTAMFSPCFHLSLVFLCQTDTMLITGNRLPLALCLLLLLATVAFATRRPSRRLFGSSKDSKIGPDSSTRHASADEIEMLERYAMLSAIAYCHLDSWNCGDYCSAFPNMTLITTFTTHKAGATGYIARDDSTNSLYIVFRGTYLFSNDVDDMRLNLVDYAYYLGAKVDDGWSTFLCHHYPCSNERFTLLHYIIT